MRKYTDFEIKTAVKTSISIAEVLRKLNYRAAGCTHAMILADITRLNLDTTHFKDQYYRRSRSSHTIPLDQILIENSNYTDSSYLRHRLIKAQLLLNQCTKCGTKPYWQGEPLTLQLDHINGNHKDNRIENLRILCPNCHTQTSTYGSRNKERKEIIEQKCNCGATISRQAKNCQKCAAVKTIRKYKIKWPTVEILIKMVEETSYTAVGKELGVSGTSIKKRIQNHARDVLRLDDSPTRCL